MNAPQSQVQSGLDWLRPFRYLLRGSLLLAHLIIALPMTLFLITSNRLPWMFGKWKADEWAIRWWSGMLCRIFGLRLRPIGQIQPGATMFVANHLSWIDIEVLHSQRAVSFVGKSEIARWPVIGWLATIGGTVYHQRGSADSQRRVTEGLAKKLDEGRSVAIFPEGRTGRGWPILPFHGRLFSAGLDADVPIQPVAIRFCRDGRFVTDLAFREGETFLGNFFRILGEPSSVAEIHFLNPVQDDAVGRRNMAQLARERVVAAIVGEDTTADECSDNA